MTLRVFLDANVLVPITMTDVLLRLATAGLIEPYWSETVLEEVDRALQRVHPQMSPDKRQTRLEAMTGAFEYATTTVDDETVSGLRLPDPDDRHVLAGAKLSGATIIVTNNMKDFPASALTVHGIEAMTPDHLLLGLLDSDPERVLDVIRVTAAATRNPPLSVERVLDSLARAEASGFARAVRAWLTTDDPA